MKITVTNRSEKAMEKCDYRNAIEYKIETKKEEVSLEFYDGEPEDSNLSRDFSDVYCIPDIIAMAYEAGKNGEEIEFINVDSDDI